MQNGLWEEESAEVTAQFLRSLPKVEAVPNGSVEGLPSHIVEIPYTISQLAYLTHNYYRYYGKYPSVLGGLLIDRYAGKGPVFDNFCGSGTSLVEARIRGLDSSGIDVNPISVLVSNVKTHRYERDQAEQYLGDILREAAIIPGAEGVCPDWTALPKWFTVSNAMRLGMLKRAILNRPRSDLRDLATVCFLSIIRRCSLAYDGEVRPHVNAGKKPRDPFEAFADKSRDMINRAEMFAQVVPDQGSAQAYCASATGDCLGKYMPFGQPALVISHPPYLNCFNYYAVFSLENGWSEGFAEVWADSSESWVKSEELACWPATNPDVVKGYYAGLRRAYRGLRGYVAPGTVLAIVIGDATVRGELLQVHRELIHMLPETGFLPKEVLYRTTHYGIGKYAYRTRADYHGDAEKRDGVVVAVAT